MADSNKHGKAAQCLFVIADLLHGAAAQRSLANRRERQRSRKSSLFERKDRIAANRAQRAVGTACSATLAEISSSRLRHVTPQRPTTPERSSRRATNGESPSKISEIEPSPASAKI